MVESEARAWAKEDEGIFAVIAGDGGEFGAEFGELGEGVPQAIGGVGGAGLERGETDHGIGVFGRVVELWHGLWIVEDDELAASGGGIGAESGERKFVEKIEQEIAGGDGVGIEDADVDAEISGWVEEQSFGTGVWRESLVGIAGGVVESAECIVLSRMVDDRLAFVDQSVASGLTAASGDVEVAWGQPAGAFDCLSVGKFGPVGEPEPDGDGQQVTGAGI